jgi:hypothetical protein
MKRLLAVMLILVAMTTMTVAQDMEWGARGIITYGGYTDITGGESKLGFGAGGAMEYAIDKDLSIVAEAMITLEGAKTGATVLGVTMSTDYNNMYLRVPVLVKYKVTPEFAVLGGVSLGYLLSAKATLTVAGVAGSEADVKGAMHDLDYGLVLGGSYMLEGFEISGRYNLGLAEIGVGSAKNYALEVGCTYKFQM